MGMRKEIAQRDTGRIHLFGGIGEKGGLSSILESAN